mgnify:CR=1 FL=1
MLAIASISLAFAPLSGISLPRASDASATVDLGALSGAKTLVVFGTYPADFNCIEYAQKLRHYQTALRAKGIERFVCVGFERSEPRARAEERVALGVPPPGVYWTKEMRAAVAARFPGTHGWWPM